jgi:hypothetical protein
VPRSISPDSEPLKPFALRHVAEIAPQPAEARWLIDSLWLAAGVGVLGGPPKVCKTFLAAELALAVASGCAALGRYAVKAPGAVLFYGAEDSLAALRVRFEGLALSRGISLDTLPLYLLDVPVLRLESHDDLRRLRGAIERCRPQLLVLDPFVRVARIDENSAQEVSAVLGSLRAFQRDYDLAVLVVHHARKTPAAHPALALRGSSDFAAWSDSNLYLTRRSRRLTLYLEHRSAAAPQPLDLDLLTEPAPHLALIDDPNHTAAHSTDDPLHVELIDHLSLASRPLPTVELRRRLGKRKHDVVQALAVLETERRIRRTASGWVLDPST